MCQLLEVFVPKCGVVHGNAIHYQLRYIGQHGARQAFLLTLRRASFRPTSPFHPYLLLILP